MDVDNDGDPDFIGARYRPGLVAWFETPKNPTAGKWKMRIADDTLNGIHGVLRGDIDRWARRPTSGSGQPVEHPTLQPGFEYPRIKKSEGGNATSSQTVMRLD